MGVWVLEGYGTDSRYPDDVRHREYTTSKRKAELFNRIPKIQFTDSGHGIVFRARPHSGKRLPTWRMDYVREQMDLLAEASVVAKARRESGELPTQRLRRRIKELEAEREALVKERDEQTVIATHAKGMRDRAQERVRQLIDTLTWVSDPSYVGNYSDAEIIEIYRTWVSSALEEAAS